MVEKNRMTIEDEYGHAARFLANYRSDIDAFANEGLLDSQNKEQHEEEFKRKAQALVAKFGEGILDQMREELRAAYDPSQDQNPNI